MKILGIACGIASVGWGLLERTASSLTIIAAGVWSFDTPELPKTRTPLAAIRRLHRGQRRVINRRRLRMNEIRRLFHDAGLLPDASSQALAQPGLNPWELRAAALSRRLTGPELAIALGHIARHRGFKSNRKQAAKNQPDELSDMMSAIAATQARLQQYQTVGLMFATDPEFQHRKRNRGDFTRSVLRADLEAEARRIFAEQRRLDSPFASAEIEDQYARAAFYQRPLQDSESLVGPCRFEPLEKRTASRSYAFELFRLLQRLANLTLSDDGRHIRLDPAMIRAIAADFGHTKRISYRFIRETLGLGPAIRFVGIPAKDEKNDVAARQGNAAEGTYTLRQVVKPEGWRYLMNHPALRDRIAELLTFRDDPTSIRMGLQEAGLPGPLLDAIMGGVEAGTFSQFQGTGHLSAKAARALLPALHNGVGYYAACEAAGYDHDAPAKAELADMRNPVARKAVGEAIKQIEAVIRAYGKPDAIHIGLMRDVGKSADERDEITRGIEAANKRRETSRAEIEVILGRRPTGTELLRYELWKEQDGWCLYSGEAIDASWLAAGENTVMIGHILPWSRFGDDSFANKTLCLTSAGQTKQDRTPYEWSQALMRDAPAGESSEGRSVRAMMRNWHAFSARVAACKGIKAGKKNGFYLRQNAAEIEEDFRNRHLSDTRTIARLLLLYLGQTYPGVRVRARASQLTAKLRRAWGLDAQKQDASAGRAVDAIVLAAISERLLEELAIAAREAERQGLPWGLDYRRVEPPAEGFREVVAGVIADIFPARAERRRVRGEIHAATIKRIRTTNAGATVFERKAVEKLTLGDLERIPIPTPYGRVFDPCKLRDEMAAALRDWIERGRPKDEPPRSSKGDLIRKVYLATREEVRVTVRGGTADRGEMARVDVFRKPGRNGKSGYYLVPVYPHQIVDRDGYPRPPDRAVVAGAAEADWAVMDADADFLFSLYSHSLLEVVKSDGEIIRGYFKGLDRATGSIGIGIPENMQALPKRSGAKTLSRFAKLRVDRLGRVSYVRREVRTWHGVAV